VFYGVGASVIGIIAQSAYKLTKKSIGPPGLLWIIYAGAFVATVSTEKEQLVVFLIGGMAVWLSRLPIADSHQRVGAFPLIAAALGASPVFRPDWPLLGRIFSFFAYAGSFVFGSGLAIVPFLYGGVVKDRAWLSDHQFLDAVAVAMITPGPVVITTGFIGYLIAGFAGAVVAATATFLPSYLLTILPAPYFQRYGKRPGLAAFIEGVTTAAIGTIAGAVIVLGRRSIVDLPSVVMLGATLVALTRTKLPSPLIVLAAAVVGLVLYPATH
jgi:chromate transporter